MIGVPRKTTTTQALDELKKRDDLESLRSYLIQDNCFPALKDPKIAPITMEELKKLARVWKLNEKRNFWKNHSERDAMVQALLEHAEQMKIFIPNKLASSSSGYNANESNNLIYLNIFILYTKFYL